MEIWEYSEANVLSFVCFAKVIFVNLFYYSFYFLFLFIGPLYFLVSFMVLLYYLS